ncbi:MAG: hypothetical protein ACKVQK_18110 [Burkholderiales bacterium]
MNRQIEATALLIALFAATTAVHAKQSDGNPEVCFPLCEAEMPEASNDLTQDADKAASEPTAMASKSCDGSAGLVQNLEKLNAQIKPAKDLVGYVRSPQGLAVKLVNDHLFKIPGWVGFALDPVGTIKRNAIDEIRGRAKELLKGGDYACKANAETVRDLSIDAS